MSQEGRGCLVGDQGGSDKVAQFKIEPGSEVRTRSSPIGSAHVVWKEKGILSFIDHYFAF